MLTALPVIASAAPYQQGGSASINNDEDEIEDDDLLALLEGEEDAERSPKNTDKSDMYGKNLKTAVARVHNSGSVSGNITARAQQLKRPLNKNSYTPQFYDISLITSGNGVSMANYIETPDKYTYSQEKQNHVHLGSLDNSGNMRDQATLEGGTRTTHTYTASKGSGNGVSLFASTGRFAKNATRVALDNVNNDGHISGQIRQISGNNSGYNSSHMMSGSEAHGSGNGISLYSDTFNAQIPRVETRLGKIDNHGSIRGDAYLKAGDGSGDLSVNARASGNGISVYQATGNASLTALGSVNNEGIIQGHIETRAGTVYSSAQRGQTIPEERARLVVSDDKTIADYYKPNPTPEKPAAAGNDNYGTLANFRADSDVRASGNGISVQYASGVGADMNSGASLGDITNGGVISGYAENYHGYARGYGRVNTLNSGADLTYQIDNNDQHALYDANRTSDVTLRGNGKLLIDTYQNDQAEREINIGGSGKLLSEGDVQTASTNHMQTVTLTDGKIKIAPRVAVQPGQSVNAQPNSTTNGTTANNTGAGATNRVTNNTTTGTTANAANNSTATNTVGSLVRLNRDQDAASATFETPYADAYNSYTSAWRNTGNNPLKNSSYLPETAQTEKAVNQYLADTVAHNPYGAVPAATLAAHQDTRRELLDNHARPLRQGETYTAISGSLARNDALKTSDSKAHDNQLGIGISHGITSDLTLGITASVGREKTNGSHDSRLKGNSHYIGAHAVKTLGDLSLTGGLTYSQTNLKGTRHINNGYDAQSHAARNKPSVTSAYAEGKYTLRLNDHLAWEPKAILAYNHLKTSSVNENGSGGLTIASRGMNTVDIGIGQDLTYSTKAGSGELRGKLSLDYIHTSGEKDLQARFNGSDSGFTLRTDKNWNTV